MALIPSNRLVDWTIGTHVGVIGGIPSRTTVYDDDGNGVTESLTLIDDTGATDVKAAIQSAIDACPVGECVVMPEGRFRLDSGLVLGTAFSGKTFRGQGDTTILDSYCNVPFIAGSASGPSYPPSPYILVTAGLSQGSTSITLDGDVATYITVGTMMVLNVENDDIIPVVSVYNYDVFTTQSPQNQLVRVTAVVADVVTFTPPLLSDYGGGSLEVRVNTLHFSASGIGLENFMVDNENYSGDPGGAYSGVQLQQCFGSWITGVSTFRSWNYGIVMAGCLNCYVRSCRAGDLKGESSNGAALLFASHSCLVEDNIFFDAFPSVEVNFGSAGNVFLYNFSNGMCDTNHAPHNRFNLHEGNAWAYAMSDGYFGSESDLTFCRCYLHDAAYGSIHLRRFSRNVSAVGCIIALDAIASQGYPNIGNSDFNGTADYPSDPWRDWAMTGELTARTNDTDGVITLASGQLFVGGQVIRLVWGAGQDESRFASVASVAGDEATIVNYTGGTALPTVGTIVSIGPGAFYDSPNGSYQERDLVVADTTIDKGNYYIDGGTTSSLGGDTVPSSLCGDTKAASIARGVDWGSKEFPAFDGAEPSTANVTRIPAGQRWIDSLPPAAPEILNDADETIFLGEAWQLQIVTDVPADDGYSATDLPVWMTLDEDTGLITGTPVEGVFEFTLHATNAIGTGDLPMTLTVRATRRAVITPVGGGARYGPTVQGAFIIL